MPVTRQDAVEAALRLLDEAGLDGVTLRRVAADLGVAAPSLYWHVKDKRELLDLVAEAIGARGASALAPRPGQPWWAWLEEGALERYRVLVTIKDSARLVAGNRPTADSYGPIDRMLGALAAAGVPPPDAMRMLRVLDAYTLGSVLERQAEEARSAEAPGSQLAPGWDPGAYPHMAAALAARVGRGGDPEAEFAEGLHRIVGGMRDAHLSRIGAGTGASAGTDAR